MLLSAVTIMLALASGWLRRPPGRVEDDKVELLAEIARLRSRRRYARR